MTLISLIFIDKFWIKLISAIVSFISTFISMFFKSFEVQNNLISHKKTAVDLLILRDKFRLLLIKIQMNNANTKELLQEYEGLQKQLGEVYKDAPNTTDEAVKRASKALKTNKDNDFSDEEIDDNLPKSLKRRSIE
ncbi:MAG: SLATT domain-containing protein [Tissierellia bacterium]|nr:SLATT domain-containing protein [Tissierellia bacterium]